MTTQRMMTACCLLGLLWTAVGCSSEATEGLRAPDGTLVTPKIGHFPMRSEGPKTFDPVKGSTVYENRCVSQVMETLVQYKYLKRPYELEPLLLTKMPEVVETPADVLEAANANLAAARKQQQDDHAKTVAEAKEAGKKPPAEPTAIADIEPQTLHFELRDDVYFHDDPCFEGGKGRKVVSNDIFVSWKRLPDSAIVSKSWWLFRDLIVGLDEYREEQLKLVEARREEGTSDRDDHFDYQAPVAGFRVINDREFTVTLKRPAAKFLWTLAMFQTSVVCHEALDTYGRRFGLHPVGTGPFRMAEEDWKPGLQMTLKRNPTYREEFFPDEHMLEDEEHGLHLAAGRKLPMLDQINISFFEQDQPMWLHFRSRDFDYAQVPNENMQKVFSKRMVEGKKVAVLQKNWRDQGVRYSPVPLLDFIFIGFNMDDKLLGGMSEEKTKLRQAICSALNWDERNETFYFGMNVVYDGVIPPMLEGHPEGGESADSFRGPDIDKARKLLEEAGHPNGKGLPVIDYYVSQGRNNREQSEMLARQLAAIGIRIKANLVDFPTLMTTVDDRKAPFFSFAWGSDYPDGENNLALFYGPNESPGSNHFNYKREEYDRMYDKIVGMNPSPERTKIYNEMQSMLLHDCPYAGSMARTRHYVIHERMKYFKPVEVFENWFKYVDIVDGSGVDVAASSDTADDRTADGDTADADTNAGAASE